MHPSVEAFAIAAGLLALGASLAHRLGFPPLPVYLLTGLLVGGGFPVEDLEPLPSLGLLLLFSVGLEFGPDRIRSVSNRALWAGAWDALMLPLGLLLGLLLGLDLRGSLLLAGVLYVSSSAVIVKLIIDLRRAANPESEVVLGVLVLEDLAVALLLALLGGQGTGLFLSLLLVLAYLLLARYLGPPLARFMETLSDELVLLLGASLTVGSALLFHALGASEGVGAFLSGVIAASLSLRERLEHLFGPVRDLGVALFFMVVGAKALSLLQGLSPWAFLAFGLGLLGKLPLNILGAKAAGLGRKRRVCAGFYLFPRGEFNLVLGALARDQGYTLVAQVAVLLVLLSIPSGALLIRFAPELYRVFEAPEKAL